MNAKTLSGGCQCGALRYAVAGPARSLAVCHCRMCQKAHGAMAVAFFTVAEDTFRWTRGEAVQFRSSDVAVREFCRDCGTVVTFRLDDDPTVDIATATLDDPEAMPPNKQYGIEAKVSWFDAIHAMPGKAAGGGPKSHQHPDHDTEAWPVQDR